MSTRFRSLQLHPPGCFSGTCNDSPASPVKTKARLKRELSEFLKSELSNTPQALGCFASFTILACRETLRSYICSTKSANFELKKFYSQTFWCNVDVFRCCQAAIAIAKRGLNVDRCFIGISPGGVGQSLYSLHLSEMYKHNHVYFDPNIWYLDEELRKQVETFARAFIMTGQEAPESSKKLHIDLYKKTISADGIMGRKPYGYSTKMFHTIGWTRLEVNRIMKFLGVGNNAFNSMFRRSLVSVEG